MNTKIHVGKMIKEFIERKNLLRTKLAQKIGVPYTAFYAYEKRDSIHTGTLLNVCHGVRHNFFMDIANQLPRDYTQNTLSDKDNLIIQLQEENKKLKLENDLMKELIKK